MSKSDDRNWALVIEALYYRDRSRFKKADDPNTYIPEDSALIGDTGLNRTQLEDAAQYLLDAGMMDIGGGYFRLTPRGFEIAHQRELQEVQEEREDQRVRRQNKVNRAVGFLTLGLLFIGTADMVVRGLVGIQERDWIILITMAAGAFGALIIALYISRTRILDPESPSDI